MSSPAPRDNRAVTSLISSDIVKMLVQSQEAFECGVFRMNFTRKPLEVGEENPEDFFVDMREREREHDYDPPTIEKAIEAPNEMMERLSNIYGNDADMESPELHMIITTSGGAITEQSIIWVNEIVAGGEVKPELYFVRVIHPIAKHAESGFIYKVIPFRGDFDAITSDFPVA